MFSRYRDFCVFVKPADFKICDVILRERVSWVKNSGPYSVRMQKNTDQKNSEYGHFSRSGTSGFPPKNLHFDHPPRRHPCNLAQKSNWRIANYKMLFSRATNNLKVDVYKMPTKGNADLMIFISFMNSWTTTSCRHRS